MTKPISDKGNEFTIQDLYPDLSPEEQREAEENLTLYLKLMIRIYERLKVDPLAYAKFEALTVAERRSTIR